MTKRLFDIISSSSALVVFSPIMLVVAILVRFKLGSPIIFKQPRPGRHGRIFHIYKFRTMNDERDHNGDLLPDIYRLTRFGQMLRKMSLDELPQLWNVWLGQMSIVGPRPLLVQYLPYYTKQEYKRFNVRPGITGLAQISGRNLLSWDERLALDVQYVEQVSLRLDLIIILRTVKKVIKQEDIAVAGTFHIGALDEERVVHRNTLHG
ncbi:sugar transferase [Paenibacillus sp. KN14-4R]|uniref:sugar transferase n=1 Tax=Paenibacillus sp. KN14-4R TaxID=3445773 RepID=UPI003FA03E54